MTLRDCIEALVGCYRFVRALITLLLYAVSTISLPDAQTYTSLKTFVAGTLIVAAIYRLLSIICRALAAAWYAITTTTDTPPR